MHAIYIHESKHAIANNLLTLTWSVRNLRVIGTNALIDSAQIRAGIVRHINIHSENKPYQCMECGKGFNFKQKVRFLVTSAIHNSSNLYEDCRFLNG